MKSLKVTTPDDLGRYHIVYLDMESGTGVTSPDLKDGHVHEVIYDPPRPMRPPAPAVPPQMDPMTGMPVMVQDPQTGQMVPDPGTPEDPGDPGKEEGEWVVRPGADGHEHLGVKEYVPSARGGRKRGKKKDGEKQSDKEILEECLSLWKEARGLSEESRKKGVESEDFYAGKQWDENLKRELEANDRAALTINEIAPAIDTLIGYQMEQRTDFRFLPQEDGDQRVADMLNVIVKRITDDCYYPREETKVFKDEVVPGRGVFHVYMDFDNIEGDLRIERYKWDAVDYGPFEKEDLSDCEYSIQHRMYSLAKLKSLNPKKAAEIERCFNALSGQYPNFEKNDNGVNGTNTDYRSGRKIDSVPHVMMGDLVTVDIRRKELRVAQVWRKQYQDVTVLYNAEDEFFFTAYDWDDEDIVSASRIPGFDKVTQKKTRMRVTRFCGDVILSDENPADLPRHDFYTVPVHGYWQNGEFWGKVEIAKDPQKEINKRRSQIMDTMNRLGASVYYTDAEVFKNSAEFENFKKKRSKPGAIFELKDVNRPPKLETGADLPAGLVNIMQLDQQNLQRLLNVVVEQGGANESGVMFMEKKKGRMTGNQFLFDNLSFAKQKLAKIVVALIQRYYSAERLERLLNSQYSKSKFKVAGEDYAKFDREEIVELLECADLTQYDVVITDSAFAPSTRMGIAMALFELIQKGAQIPADLPLRFIDMPADVRAEITDRLDQESQAQAQAAMEASNAEVAKTVLGKGQYTLDPQKAQELGLVPVSGSENSALPNPQNGGQDMAGGADQSVEYANNLASALAG